ncbi:TrkA C-terminal domain-containing protein [Clostridium sp. C105KSO13]|uniref:TrkA C-terminal domain-containing protein n=1 Tax=Clostridium sp. C105KSO13 TaxID=1776045 RepID=UPI0007407B1E|nr:TrkA C-terminal domain-containing protein [Clostridium sp. C105KSO13]CUX31516.1 K(+)/H(+) antiporter subunit KhtT [Clostridium sp. C105KSO13]
MKYSKNTPVYSRVAYDIASQITNGKLKEGQRFSGRSLMGSQYGVSSETIRRAMNLLANMNVIEVQQNVGATVISRENAIDYVEHYKSDNDRRALKAKLKDLTQQRDQLNNEINSTFEKIMDLEERFQNSDQLKTYEFPIQDKSKASGRTLGELQFRQNTGGTVIAIRKGEELILSPDSQTVLQEGDVLVIACNVANLTHVSELVSYFSG